MEAEHSRKKAGFADVFVYQLGNKGAIQRLVRSRWSLVIGLLLVLTGGIAEQYDLLDLRADRSWMVPRIWGEIVSALVIFCIVYSGFYFVPRLRNPPFGKQFVPFLAAYMMTAPIGWLHALPVEVFLAHDVVQISRVNFGLIALIGFWKALLLTRIISVITTGSSFRAFWCVMIGWSILTFFRSLGNKLEIAGLTGRAKLTPAEEFLSETYEMVNMISFVTGIIALIMLFWPSKKERVEPEQFRFSNPGIPLAAIFAAIVIFAVWVGIATPWQLNPELRQNRAKVIQQIEQKTEVESAPSEQPAEPPKPKDDPTKSNY